MSVVVYVIRDENHTQTEHRSKVANLFSENCRIVIPDIHYKDILSKDRLTERHEAYQIGWCLTDARDNHSSKSILIIKDSSVCDVESEMLDVVLQEVETQRGNFDVCYFGKWNDRCHLYSRRTRILDTHYDLVKTSSPQGIQAIFFSPTGRDVILGAEPMKNGEYFHSRRSIAKSLSSNIKRGNVEAYCVTPNIIHYDLRLALKDEDYLKRNECECVSNVDETRSGVNRYVALFVIIILLVIIIAAAITVYPL